MERKEDFVPGEYYHIFSRGVEKRKIFQDTRDYKRFLALLYILNQERSFHLNDYLKRGKKNIEDVYKEKREKPLVFILAYSLLPNHFHLLILENEYGGISKFMGKLLTAYSMYFNTKYERSGPLFVRPFRSRHADDDIYFRHLFSYIHLNCIDLYQKNWKLEGIKNSLGATDFLTSYRYSSYQYFSKYLNSPEHKIIDEKALPEFIPRSPLKIEDFQGWYSEMS